ncbi:MAG: hypothetical protein WB803_18250, partial [Pseudolabrys sp.]
LGPVRVLVEDGMAEIALDLLAEDDGGGEITMRAIGRDMSHSSSASTGQMTRRTPFGNFSSGRPSIGE